MRSRRGRIEKVTGSQGSTVSDDGVNVLLAEPELPWVNSCTAVEHPINHWAESPRGNTYLRFSKILPTLRALIPN